MGTSPRDAIANYLLQFFVEDNDDCEKPLQVDVSTSTGLRRFLSLSRDRYDKLPSTSHQGFIFSGVQILASSLGCGTLGDTVQDELMPSLQAVLDRQSQTLRPFLDILIERGVYPDPDLDVLHTTHLDGKAAKEAATERAWKQEFYGDSHKTLLENIRKDAMSHRDSSNMAVIQSSGFGKSRVVDQMATLIPTIPMNVRAEETPGAYPPADKSLFEMFTFISSRQKPKAYLEMFLDSLFNLVYDLAAGFAKETFAMDLHNYFGDPVKRARLYSDLLDLVQNYQLPVSGYSTKEPAVSLRKLLGLFRSGERDQVEMILYVDEIQSLANMYCDSGGHMYQQLFNVCDGLKGMGAVFLFISTEPYMTFPAPTPGPISSSARMFAIYKRYVAPFTGMPFDDHPSLEASKRPPLMLEKFQDFSFAVRSGRPLFAAHYDAMIANGEDAAQAHICISNMAQTMLAGKKSLFGLQNSGKLALLDVLLNLKYEKRDPWTNDLATRMVGEHMRVAYIIDAERTHMYSGYSSEPVLAEAALTYLNRKTLDKDKASLGLLLPLYRDLSDHTKIALVHDQCGDTAGKMVLLLAYVAAVAKQEPPASGIRFWGQGCSLVSFLEELTGENYIEAVLGSVPDNLRRTRGTALKTAFKNSWVRFTHFALGDGSVMTSVMACVAFVRGMAMIDMSSKKTVSVSIPVLLDKDKPVNEANITAILVQFNMRSPENLRPGPEDAVSEHEIGFFPESDPFADNDEASDDADSDTAPDDLEDRVSVGSPPDANAVASSNDKADTTSNEEAKADAASDDAAKRAYRTRPYISLVMELGLPGPYTTRRKVVHLMDRIPGVHDPYAASDQEDELEEEDHSDLEDIHPRYSLFYYGFSHRVYQCLPDSEELKEVSKDLIQVPDAEFKDRPGDRPATGVRQMKSSWAAGPNYFSWVDDPWLNQNLSDDLGEEEVVVGKAGRARN